MVMVTASLLIEALQIINEVVRSATDSVLFYVTGRPRPLDLSLSGPPTVQYFWPAQSINGVPWPYGGWQSTRLREDPWLRMHGSQFGSHTNWGYLQ